MNYILRSFFLFLFIIPTFVFAEPANLALLKQEIRKWHESGAYEQELESVIKGAKAYILRSAAQNQHSKHPKRLALVLDIDETSLSNSQNILENDFASNMTQIRANIMKANSPAIRPMLELYQAAQKANVAVFFVTGRPAFQKEATKTNLERAGYHHWAGLYLRTKEYEGPTVVPFKSHVREEITKKGYEIVANIGDQESDLKGGFSQKTFKLPNPFYYLP